jgi:hypothetical protein
MEGQVEWSHVGTLHDSRAKACDVCPSATRGPMLKLVRVILSLHVQTRTFPAIIGCSLSSPNSCSKLPLVHKRSH